jgi:hypothetical protein
MQVSSHLRVLINTILTIFNKSKDKDPMLYRCRLLLYSGRYGATNRWYQEFKLLHGDYFEKSFQRVREQVSTLSTLKNIVRCGNLEDELHMLFLCPFSRRLGSAILDLSKLNVLQNIIDLFPIRSKLCSPRNIRKLPQTLFTLFCGVSGKLVTTLCFAGKCVNLLKCLRQKMQLFQEPQWRLRKS